MAVVLIKYLPLQKCSAFGRDTIRPRSPESLLPPLLTVEFEKHKSCHTHTHLKEALDLVVVMMLEIHGPSIT